MRVRTLGVSRNCPRVRRVRTCSYTSVPSSRVRSRPDTWTEGDWVWVKEVSPERGGLDKGNDHTSIKGLYRKKHKQTCLVFILTSKF